MTSSHSWIESSRIGLACSALALLSACGGGGGSGGETGRTTPLPNPVTIAPTLTCSAAGIVASNASTMSHTVCMLTSSGEMVIGLETEKAPITVANFLKYVNAGYYSNTIFHRVVKDFVVQGGGFATGSVAKPAPYAPIVLENQNGLSNLRGTIAMARTSDPDSATGQFYFNTVDNTALNYSSATAGKNGYAVFGKVIFGIDPIFTINALPRLNGFPETTDTEVLLYWAQQLK